MKLNFFDIKNKIVILQNVLQNLLLKKLIFFLLYLNRYIFKNNIAFLLKFFSDFEYASIVR